MRSRCTTLVACLLACVLVVATAQAESGDASDPKVKSAGKVPAPKAGARPPGKTKSGAARAGSLRALQERIAALKKAIAALVVEAKRDPDESRIDIYLGYSVKELKLRKRQVDAEDLLSIMLDTTNTPAVREKARQALRGGTLRGDIDLSRDHRKAGMTNRAWFCRQRVAEHLKSEDRDTRRLSHLLLSEWYRVRGVSAILSYKYDEKKTWGRAITAWKKELKKRK